jgi:hypothetical protein
VKELRGSRGLGAMLLHHALVNLHRKGVAKVLIDWTSKGLLDRYYGPAGFKLYVNYPRLKTGAFPVSSRESPGFTRPS